MTRRALARIVAIGFLVLSVGCLGGMSGESGMSFAADPVRLDDAAVTESRFTVTAERTIQFNQSVAVGGEERTVKLQVGMVQAQQTGNTPVPAHLSVLSVPEIEVVGQAVSVASRFEPVSVVNRAGSMPGELTKDRKIEDQHFRILGENRTVSVYRGTTSNAGSDASVMIYETTFDHKTDTLIIVGMVPVGMSDSTASLRTLLTHIEHP